MVCAAPLAVAKDIRLAPGADRSPWPSWSTAAQAASVTHVYFAVEKPFWEDDIGEPALFTDTALERVFAHQDPDDE